MRKKEKEEEEKKKKRQMECLYKTGNINTGTSSSNLFSYHNRIFFFFWVNKGLDKIVPDLALEGKKSGMKRKLLFNE